MAEPVWLLIVAGKQVQTTIRLGSETQTLGSGPGNSVVLPAAEGVAGRHALIEGKPGKYFLRDLETREGVFVNGRRVVLHRLQLNDQFTLGKVRILVVLEEEDVSQAPPPVAPTAPMHTRRSGAFRKPVLAAEQRPPAPSVETPPVPAPPPLARGLGGQTLRPLPAPAPIKPPQRSPAAPVHAPPAAGHASHPPPQPFAAPPQPFAAPPQPFAAPSQPVGAPPRPLPQPAAPELPIDALLREARGRKASDVHLLVDMPALFRINGRIERVRGPLSAAAVEALVFQACTAERRARIEQVGDIDFCYEIGAARYRTNLCRYRLGWSATFRVVKEELATTEELGLPPECERVTEFAQGLVLLTGPIGAGKTTTMMALVDRINAARHDHIISIEDPIEFLIPPDRCQVSQRELGRHTQSFAAALRAALREDPDVIVIGDLRDYDTARLAISAAETGHLVFASMNAMSAAKTLDKLIDLFPAPEQAVVRTTVSESLRAIICQRLLPGIDGALVVATELLFNSVGISNIIREGKTSSLKSAMQVGRAQGMRTLQASVDELVRAKRVAQAVAESVGS